MSAAVEMRGVSKYFQSVVANDKINFVLEQGTVHALVGENGAGKTTLMRILCGIYRPDEGQILIHGQECSYDVTGGKKLGIAMVHQNFMQIPEMSVLENVILGQAPRKKIKGLIDYHAARARVQELLKLLGMDINPSMPIQRLSVGERQKIEIIKVLYLGADILIFDEPTAVLTPQEAQDLFRIINRLKADGKSIIYISHKLKEVVEIADMATVMRGGKVVASCLKKEDITTDALAAAMVGRPDFKMIENEDRSTNENKVLTVEDLWYFDENTKSATVKDLSFYIRSGEILGIGGVEGNGQRELAELLMGIRPADAGRIFLNGTDISSKSTYGRREAGIGFISEDRMTTGLSVDSSLQDNIISGKEKSKQFSRGFLLKRKEIDRFSQQLAEDFHIKGARLNAPVRSLSGGNMQKVILAREISRDPSLLIAAHPTRGLDIGAILFVREQLLEQKKKGAGILLITADLDELLALSDRVLIMYEGKFTGEILDTNNVSIEDIGLMMGGITGHHHAQI